MPLRRHPPATARYQAMSLPADPVRLCCGERHSGVQCPDGLVMCCLCFTRVPLNGLHKTGSGYEDACLSCAADEIWYQLRTGPATRQEK
jgi:hypothetical protein